MTAFALGFVLAVLWVYLVATVIAAFRFAKRQVAMPAAQPPATVLKPLHGAEPGLYENLCSFVDQDYPKLQLVLGVRDRDDSALPVVRALVEARPGADIALVIDPRVTGSNLKVANLENMLPAAKHTAPGAPCAATIPP